MAKELFISSSPHEMKVAVLEDDQLVEVYYERDTDVGLVGGIYKGRVSRVLPGMQSAFVNIGLERDAFLYVSDFFLEDMEDYDKLVEEAESRVARPGIIEVAPHVTQAEAPAPEPAGEKPAAPIAVRAEAGESVAQPAAPTASAPPPRESRRAPPVPAAVPPVTPGPTGEPSGFRRHEGRGRHRRRPGRGFPEPGFIPKPEHPAPSSFEILPGESLAKYAHVGPEATPPSALETESSEVAGEATARQASPEAASETPSFTSEATTGAALEQPGVLPESPVAKTTAPLVAVAAELPVQTVPTEPMPEEVRPRPSVPEAAAPAIESAGDVAHPEPPETTQVKSERQAEQTEEGPVHAEAGTDVTPEDGFIAAEGSVLEEAPIVSGEPESPADDTAEEIELVSEYPPTPDFEGGPLELVSNGLAAEPAEESPAEGIYSEEDDATAVIGSPGALLGGVSEGSSEVATPQEAATTAAPAQPPAAPTPDRTYTLREPHQRPRFAPRRGRRGPRGMPRPFRQEAPRPAAQAPQIAQLLKEGQEILVQIAKEPLGTKGARITSHIALPGRYLVFMPTITHIGISRKIGDEAERLRLRNIILENKGSLTGGFIVRTAGEGRSEEEFKADLKFLTTLWNNIRSKTERAKAPALIHRDLDLIQRLLRDILSPDFKSVRVDSEVDYERVLDFVNQCQPSLIGHVKLYTRDTPLFEEFGIQAEIEKALKPKVWLKSGGYIVINQTEALVAIDINTGKYVGKTNRLEDTILKTNIEAINEVVRQLRLRDLGGIIIVDFIDMEERKNRYKVVQALEEALRHDRAPTKVVAFADFGLVGITRKRVRQSLERTLCEPCDYCSGSGWVKSVTTVCYEILAEVRKMAHHLEGNTLTLRVNPEVGKALKSREGIFIAEMESFSHKDIIIKTDPTVPQERFEIF